MTSQNTSLEREVKLRIDGRDDYERLARALPVPRRWGLQLNVYLDTAERRLRALRVSLRIRVTPDHARLTMKTPWGLSGAQGADPVVYGSAFIEQGGLATSGEGDQSMAPRWDRDSSGAFVHRETEIEIARAVAVEWIRTPELARPWDFPDFAALEDLLNGSSLVVSGWSLTRRAICDTPAGITLELDETVFPDGFRDFEIEIEYPDSMVALRAALEYARRAGVVLHTQDMSKHARARAHKGDLPWVIPAGGPLDALPPLFPDVAPTWLFGGAGTPGA